MTCAPPAAPQHADHPPTHSLTPTPTHAQIYYINSSSMAKLRGCHVDMCSYMPRHSGRIKVRGHMRVVWSAVTEFMAQLLICGHVIVHAVPSRAHQGVWACVGGVSCAVGSRCRCCVVGVPAGSPACPQHMIIIIIRIPLPLQPAAHTASAPLWTTHGTPHAAHTAHSKRTLRMAHNARCGQTVRGTRPAHAQDKWKAQRKRTGQAAPINSFNDSNAPHLMQHPSSSSSSSSSSSNGVGGAAAVQDPHLQQHPSSSSSSGSSSSQGPGHGAPMGAVLEAGGKVGVSRLCCMCGRARGPGGLL